MKSLPFTISSSIFFLLLLCLSPGLSAQVVLKPSIGLAALPSDTASICDAPWALGPNYDNTGLFPGDTAADFTLYDTAGMAHNLGSYLNTGKPVLLVAGSYTCPVFRNKISLINNLQATYGNSLNILVVYELEAHPHTDTSIYYGFPMPTNQNLNAGILYEMAQTYGERKSVAKDMLDSLPINVPVLMDGPCNEFWAHYGPAPQNAYLIDTTGRVFVKHPWFDAYPNDIYCDIDSLLGLPTSCGGSATGTFQWTLTGNDTVWGPAGQTLAGYGRLTNNSGQDVLIEMVKLTEAVPADWSTSMCAIVCYSPMTDSTTIQLAAGSYVDYTMYFYTGPNPGTGYVRMGFRNVNNQQNFAIQRFTAVTDAATAIEQLDMQEKVEVYPHPVRDRASVRVPAGYETAVFVLYDLQGRRVMSRELSGDPVLNLDTKSLRNGIYLYELRGVDGNNLKGKILVQK